MFTFVGVGRYDDIVSQIDRDEIIVGLLQG